MGEIHDENDPEEEEIVRIGDDTVECDASVDVREIDEALGISLPKAGKALLSLFSGGDSQQAEVTAHGRYCGWRNCWRNCWRRNCWRNCW